MLTLHFASIMQKLLQLSRSLLEWLWPDTCTLVFVASHHKFGQKGMDLQGCMKGVTDGQHQGEGCSYPSLSSSLLGWDCWVALAPSPDSRAPSQTGKKADLFPKHPVKTVVLAGLTGMHETGCSGDKACPART